MAEAKVAVVTGVGRSTGIGAAIVRALAEDHNDVVFTWWRPYDERVHGETDVTFSASLAAEIEALGRRSLAIEADLEDPASAQKIFDAAQSSVGTPSILILSHCESVDSSIADTTVESFDRHFAVNARASWLLMKEFGERFAGTFGSGRIVSLTSDHTVGNLPYGASKGALDRITVAASREFAPLGITANAINPGPTDTGWMSEEQKSEFSRETPAGRLGTPSDCARIVSFLCSDEGGWVNGQIIQSDGGIHS